MPRDAPVMTATFRSDFMFAPSRDQCTDGRTVIPVEAMRLRIACSIVVISCGDQTQIAASAATSGCQAAPILRRCPTRGLPECTGEIGLTREPEREGDIDQRPIRIGEQFLGALQTPCADMPMRRLADGGLEGAREMELAQAGNRRQPR